MVGGLACPHAKYTIIINAMELEGQQKKKKERQLKCAVGHPMCRTHMCVPKADKVVDEDHMGADVCYIWQ
jgi:hypothetical protein